MGKGGLRVVANNLKSPGDESAKGQKGERGEEVRVAVAVNILKVL